MSRNAAELIGAVVSALAAVILVVAVGLTRLRERVARLEEWVRIREKDRT